MQERHSPLFIFSQFLTKILFIGAQKYYLNEYIQCDVTIKNNRSGENIMRRIEITVSVAIALATLAGCGGGGGSGGPSQEQLDVTIPLLTTIGNYVNLTRSSPISIQGEASGSGQTVQFTGAGTFSESPSGGTFENQPAIVKNMSLTATLYANGSSQPVSDSQQTYFDSNYRILGQVSAGSYCVTSAFTTIPSSARVGENGPWYSLNCYSSSSKTALLGTVAVTWVLEPDSSASALLKVLSTYTDTGGGAMPVTTTVRVTTAGAITRLQETTTLTVDGVLLNMTVSYQ